MKHPPLTAIGAWRPTAKVWPEDRGVGSRYRKSTYVKLTNASSQWSSNSSPVPRLAPGQYVLDLATGTWLGRYPRGICGRSQWPGERRLTSSPEMLALAQQRGAALGLTNCSVFKMDVGESQYPLRTDLSDVLLASLSLDVRRRSRCCRPGDSARATSWRALCCISVGGAGSKCDIVLFQQTAWSVRAYSARFGGRPESLCQIQLFLAQLANGVAARVETEVLGFDFDDFASAGSVSQGIHHGAAHGTAWKAGVKMGAADGR